MSDKLRVGAVSYLNTKPLVYGLERGLAADRIDLSYDVPAQLAEQMQAGRLDIALLPVIELGRMPGLEVVPGLAIACDGDTRSVLLVAKRPFEEIESVALDPESRTSNALTLALLGESFGVLPRVEIGHRTLEAALEHCDAAVRIGDKALFEPVPDGLLVQDLGRAWKQATGLPFVFAAWIARPGVVDREIYRALHDSRRRGSRPWTTSSASYTWSGAPQPELALAYPRRDHPLPPRFQRGVERWRHLLHTGRRAGSDRAFFLGGGRWARGRRRRRSGWRCKTGAPATRPAERAAPHVGGEAQTDREAARTEGVARLVKRRGGGKGAGGADLVRRGGRGTSSTATSTTPTSATRSARSAPSTGSRTTRKATFSRWRRSNRRSAKPTNSVAIRSCSRAVTTRS